MVVEEAAVAVDAAAAVVAVVTDAVLIVSVAVVGVAATLSEGTLGCTKTDDGVMRTFGVLGGFHIEDRTSAPKFDVKWRQALVSVSQASPAGDGVFWWKPWC